MDVQNCGRHIFSPLNQVSLPFLFLQAGDEGEENGMEFDPKHVVHVGILTAQGYNRSGPPRLVIDLYPGLVGKGVPVGDNLAMAQTFLNQFVKVEENYSATGFRMPGWFHSTKK